MTINEAIEKGLKTVRCDPWNPYCRMELPERLPDGTHGIWGYIIDPPGNIACDHEADRKIGVLLAPIAGQLSTDPNVDEWQEWVPPADIDRFSVFHHAK